MAYSQWVLNILNIIRYFILQFSYNFRCKMKQNVSDLNTSYRSLWATAPLMGQVAYSLHVSAI